jgi:hypothetical protein
MGATLRASFAKWLGLHEEVMLRRSPLFAYLFDECLSDLNESELKAGVHRMLMDLDGMQNFLWLFKDHAAQAVRGLVVFESKPCFVLQHLSLSTKGDASEGNTTFRRIEIESAQGLCDLVFPIRARRSQEHENELVHIGKSRMARAMRFVATARSTTSLAIKIASHCSALESLLRWDNHKKEPRLSDRLGKRVSALVAHSSESRATVESQVREMYVVRSKLFHGQLLESRRTRRLVSIAKNADHVVRTLIRSLFGNEELQPMLVRSLNPHDDEKLQRRLDEISGLPESR